MRDDKRRTRCESLDFVQASRRDRVYPLMYCRMELKGELDIKRLKQAVSMSGRIVPEILFSYDFRKGCFIDLGYTVEDVVKLHVEGEEKYLRPDLSKHPQLQLILASKGNCHQVVIVMSHILADGAGFLQYLYLLVSLYNGEQGYNGMKNERKIAPILKDIHVRSDSEQVKYHSHISVPPLLAREKGSRLFCLNCQIPAGDMAKIRLKANQSGITLNDVFLTAYARVISRIKNMDTVVIPCPADLRKFRPVSSALTVANMTGIYRRVAVEIPPGASFRSVLQQVHIEMLLQKSRRRCFAGIKTLDRAFGKIPHVLLEKVIKTAYPLYPVSYTNFGRIDHEKVRFKDISVVNCYFTGTYRYPPDFQLTVSTFRDVCTLNCAFMGAQWEQKKGQDILELVKQEILTWAEKG